MLSLEHDRSLIVTVALVAANEFLEHILVDISILIGFDADFIAHRTFHRPGTLCDNTDTGVHGCLRFHTGSDHRSLCCQERHRLTLHVGAHECTVRIVILQERNQCRRHGEHHLRRYVHEVKHVLIIFLRFFFITTGHGVADKMSFLIQFFVCLRHMEIIFLVRSHVNHFVCHHRILRIGLVYLTIRCLYESVLIDTCV